ncbi:MAG: hypothetical protein M3Z97_10315 [Candidatus Dormibacteraeota bacterium]|nr:hypothetical protein [Candidatus Dormibacteraeota bacterium]
MSTCVRGRRAWRWMVLTAAGCSLLAAHPVLATSPSPSSAPAPSPSGAPAATVPPTSVPVSPPPTAAAVAKPFQGAASSATPAAAVPSGSASPEARPSGSASASAPAASATAGQPHAAQAAGSGPGSTGQVGTSGAFCPQLNFSPLSGCQALPAPLRAAGLAPTGAPLLVGLIGLSLMVAGWLVYRRSRRPATVPETGSPGQDETSSGSRDDAGP